MESIKQYKKDFSKLGWMYVIGTAVIYAVQFGVMGIVKNCKPEWLENVNISLMLSVLPMYLIGMPILISLVKRLPARAPEKHTMKPWQFMVAVIMCYAVMYCSNLAGTVLTTIIGMLKGSAVNNAILNIATSANMGITFFYMVICAPFLEEYVFRKLIVDRTIRYGQGAAIVVSGLMFGLFHGNLSQFVYAAALGMFLAFLYVKTGKLKITIAIHMLVNFMGSIVSVLVLKAIHYDEIAAVSLTGDQEALMELVMEHMAGWMLYMSYAGFIIALIAAGIIFFIVFRGQFTLQAGEVVLPKGKRFSTIFLNPGMMVYCAVWIVIIVLQIFMG